MNLLQGPVGQSLPPPTEAGPGFQSGNKFDIDMCVHAAQGRGGRWCLRRGLTSWWPTCLPCQWQQCDGRRRNRKKKKQRTENENRKQKTKQKRKRKQLKSYVKKVGKCKHCLVSCAATALPAELKGNDACNIVDCHCHRCRC